MVFSIKMQVDMRSEIAYIERETPFIVSDIKLRVEINNNKPVDLLYMTDSFISLSQEYKRHLAEEGKPFNIETRLYVKEIKSGSIITDLVNLMPVAMAIADNIDPIVKFVGFIKTAYGYYSKLKGSKPEYTVQTLKNLDSIVEPVAKDNNAQMVIAAINAENVIINNYTINTDSANAAQNRMREEIQALETPQAKPYTKVVMALHQAVNGAPNSGDKGIIESISQKPLKIIWDDNFKSQAVQTETNFFNIAFVVDCEVHTVRGIPTAYKILKIHDTIS